jgi:hypothetical protein
MSIELPVLRLGLAGFSAEQQERLGTWLPKALSGALSWQPSKFSDADAWWIHGGRVQQLGDGTLRVASGVPGGRSIQLNMAEIDRPVAFSIPLAQRDFEPVYRFEADSEASMNKVLARFEAWLRPLAAQFCLASHIIEHETALGSGIYHVSTGGTLLAVVNLQGEVGVLPTAGPADFENAMWAHRPHSAGAIPEGFVKASLSQLMWQYAVRTSRDVLPKRYRSGKLYFRRPPRLPQRLLRDSHLLLMRELAGAPASFEELRTRTDLGEKELAHDLAALYLVGTITSNPKRAGSHAGRNDGESTHGLSQASVPSGLDAQASGPGGIRRSDMTAPAPMSLE